MEVTVYLSTGIRKCYHTAHEVLEHSDGAVSITFTDTRENVFKSDRYEALEFERMTVKP